MSEMHHGRNSIVVDAFQAGEDVSCFRARWANEPLQGGSRLFHRWVLRADDDGASSSCVEHLNDIPLDCRRANLRTSCNRVDNNQAPHRLAKALRDGRLLQVAEDMAKARAAYTDVVAKLPPLPESVFVAKRKRERLGVPRDASKRVAAAQASTKASTEAQPDASSTSKVVVVIEDDDDE